MPKSDDTPGFIENRPVDRNSRHARVIGLVASLVMGFTGACREKISVAPTQVAKESPWFDDVTSQAGLTFVHDAGEADDYFMPRSMGSGAALFDYDNDGRLDIYLVQNAGPESKSSNQLFHQEADGRFLDVSPGSGLDVASYGMGVAVGDVNNDGWPDVLLTGYGDGRLFLNCGGGRFDDVTLEAGFTQPSWGMSAAFFDYDRDGWLDLVVVNYLDYERTRPCGGPGGTADFCGPANFRGTVTRLYHHCGNTIPNELHPTAPQNAKTHTAQPPAVKFEDVTLASGLGNAIGPGLGVVCADFSGDHWPDILVANDGKPNHLWINQQDNTFTEEAVLSGIAFNSLGDAPANMGIAVGDVDHNGALDVFVTHLTEERHTLWLQDPKGQFRDGTALAGLGQPRWRGTGFGTLLTDFDADGELDLAIANGRVKRHTQAARVESRQKIATASSFWDDYAERNQLFVNEGNHRFHDVSDANAPFCETPAVSRGLVLGDIDNDGAVDLLVTSIASPARLFRNVAPRNGHWLTIRTIDPALHRDAYGAEVTVLAGKRRWFACMNPAASYLCSNDPRAHFGLGSAAAFDEIDVVWPNGKHELFAGGNSDRSIVLRHGEGTLKAGSAE